jgi:hypothetical protein
MTNRVLPPSDVGQRKIVAAMIMRVNAHDSIRRQSGGSSSCACSLCCVPRNVAAALCSHRPSERPVVALLRLYAIVPPLADVEPKSAPSAWKEE